ncbi:MAG: hypothetical protein Tp1138SUR256061_34 [Prokaryotic dsDNA virus sp.]|jgi:hypothetical protein|nr:MAG: hypothetical protein Tp1138SUR256061_34 [Prokaryotic dsDNA virus sp.]|tara:strand:- start:483 stop:623 length:141 start_codon:yes stop_codon:yes gene_type:complete
MIKNIIDLLQVCEGETENIRIAQGKYALPMTFKKAYKQLKNELRWQ